MKNLKLALVAMAVAGGTQLAAQAGLSQFNIGYYTDDNNAVTLHAQGYTHSTYATAFSVDRVGGDPIPFNHTDPFVSFCLDINTYIGNGYWQSGGFSSVPSVTTPGDPNNPTGPAVRNVSSGLYTAANLYMHYAGAFGHASGNGSSMVLGNKLY